MDYKKKYLKYKNKYLNLKGGKKYNSIQEYKEENTRYGDKCIIARVLRGQNDDDFNKLANNRKLVFLTPGGIELLNKKSTKEMLENIGYDEAFIEDLKNEKTKFKLALLDECENSKDYKLATWDNLLELFLEQYPEIKSKLNELPKGWEEELKKIESENIGKKDEKITMKDLMKDFTIPNLRDFMNDIENINKLYRGDGFIQNEDGKKLGKEYITKNTEKCWCNNDNYPHLINLTNLDDTECPEDLPVSPPLSKPSPDKPTSPEDTKRSLWNTVMQNYNKKSNESFIPLYRELLRKNEKN